MVFCPEGYSHFRQSREERLQPSEEYEESQIEAVTGKDCQSNKQDQSCYALQNDEPMDLPALRQNTAGNNEKRAVQDAVEGKGQH